MEQLEQKRKNRQRVSNMPFNLMETTLRNDNGKNDSNGPTRSFLLAALGTMLKKAALGMVLEAMLGTALLTTTLVKTTLVKTTPVETVLAETMFVETMIKTISNVLGKTTSNALGTIPSRMLRMMLGTLLETMLVKMTR